MEVIALAGPFIAFERDAVRAVVAAESDIEAFEGDPLRLFGVALRLLDLGDEARVHELLHQSACTGGAGHGDSRLGLFWSRGYAKRAVFQPGRGRRQRSPR